MNVQAQVGKFKIQDHNLTANTHIAALAHQGFDMFRIPRGLNFRANIDVDDARDRVFRACDGIFND
eukprot:2692898-Karenia_brevis.AAC.1